MNITDALLIFVGGFASVFTLGFQSRAVNGRNYLLAAMMSFVVAMSQAHLWFLIVKDGATTEATLLYGLSGMVAITSAMFLHQRFFTKKPETK